MAESLYDKHGTSDEFNDPYCDICAKIKNINVRPEGYCHDCYYYLCKDCLAVHSCLPSTSSHVILTGDGMPKSQADKPPRFEYCDVQNRHLKEIMFPSSSTILSQASATGYQPSGNTKPNSKINAQKHNQYNIKLRDDKYGCYITGLCITLDGRRLLADYNNSKVKMFSRDMKIISSLTLPAEPWDIAVSGDREAVVSVYHESKLFILDVSDKQMSIGRTLELSFRVYAIVTHKYKFVVTSQRPFPSVRLIDRRGKCYWSTSTDQQGHQLFSGNLYVSCYDDGRSSTVIVTDTSNNTMTLLNSDTGDVVRKHQVERKEPRGVTTDTAGNVYVCYWWTREVAVLSRDFSEEKVLLAQRDGIREEPQAIVYDAEDHWLLVSYYFSHVVDCFKLL